MFVISVSFFSACRSAILRIRPPSPPFLTMKGSSVIDDVRPCPACPRSMCALRAHAHPAAAGLVRVADAGQAEDHAAGREVRALDVLHQARRVDVRVVDVGDRGRDRLAQVVRRDVRGHADGDAAGAVDQQVREPRRQHDRLVVLAVVVGLEVDRVGVQVAQHLARDRRQPRLRVPHGGGRVVVDRAEVALAVDERCCASRSPAPGARACRRSPSRRAGGTCPSRRRRCGRTSSTARFGCRPFSFIANSTRRWTGFRPSRTSGSARPTMTDMA